MAEQVARVLDNNAEAAARAAHCSWRRTWVTKSRPGLANHALAEATYRNIVLAGAPRWGGEAIRLAQEIQARARARADGQALSSAVAETTIPPQEAESAAAPRHAAVAAQHRPRTTTPNIAGIARRCVFTSRGPMLKAPPGFAYPAWAMNALGGMPPCIDPMIRTAAKVVGATIIDLIGDADLLARARQANGASAPAAASAAADWMAPLLPSDFRVPHRFPLAGIRHHGARQGMVDSDPLRGPAMIPCRRSGRLALAGRAAALRLGRGGLRLLHAGAQRFHQVDDIARTLGRLLLFDRVALGLALDQLLESDLIFVLEAARVEFGGALFEDVGCELHHVLADPR